jgi:hypothetical protein
MVVVETRYFASQTRPVKLHIRDAMLRHLNAHVKLHVGDAKHRVSTYLVFYNNIWANKHPRW